METPPPANDDSPPPCGDHGPRSTYELRRLVLGSSARIELSGQDFRDVLRARDLILLAIEMEEKFDLVVSNLQAFERALFEASLDHMLRSDFDFNSLNNLRVALNLPAVNLLSACRVYLDHGASHVSAVRSLVPELALDFRQLTNQQHSESRLYRVADALRNYAQHRGFPLKDCSLGGRRVDGPDGEADVIRFRTAANIDAEGMLDDDRTTAKIREDLAALGTKIDARTVLRAYVACLARIHAAVRHAIEHPIEEAERFINRTIERYQAAFPSEASTVGLAAVSIDPDGRILQRVYVFHEPMKRRRYFLHRNLNLEHLEAWHVSSEPVR
jgi:hypothetical protein